MKQYKLMLDLWKGFSKRVKQTQRGQRGLYNKHLLYRKPGRNAFVQSKIHNCFTPIRARIVVHKLNKNYTILTNFNVQRSVLQM